jgi:hypothetical protein
MQVAWASVTEFSACHVVDEYAGRENDHWSVTPAIEFSWSSTSCTGHPVRGCARRWLDQRLGLDEFAAVTGQAGS